eukprot:scaffold8454_cov136-Cylindrotheca_fusiformis.AAC.4
MSMRGIENESISSRFLGEQNHQRSLSFQRKAKNKVRRDSSFLMPVPTQQSRKGGKPNQVSGVFPIHFDGFTSSSDDDGDNAIDRRLARSRTRSEKKQKVEQMDYTGQTRKQQAVATATTAVLAPSVSGRKRRVSLSPLEQAARLQSSQLTLKKRKKNQSPRKTMNARFSSTQPESHYGSSTISTFRATVPQPPEYIEAMPPPRIKRMSKMPYGHRSCLSTTFTSLTNHSAVPGTKMSSFGTQKEKQRQGDCRPSKFPKEAYRTQWKRFPRLFLFLFGALAILWNIYESTGPQGNPDSMFRIPDGWKANAKQRSRDSIFLRMDESNEIMQSNEESSLYWPFSTFS